MSVSRAHATLAATLVLAVALGTGCSAVVGATCADGLVLCTGRCVDVRTDPDHCGACGTACGPRVACVLGRCEGEPDASTPDGGDASLDGALADTGGLDADRPDGEVTDAGGSDGGLHDADALDDATADAAESDTGTDAGPPCLAPETYCSPLCVDLATDSEHCGRCGNVCASGLCSAGTCVSAFAGHVVLVGHDYETSRLAMRRIVGNSVFLARSSRVAVIAYEGSATVASRDGTDAAIDATALAVGRTWTRTVATAGEVPALLATADVLLVYAQRDATDATLASLGSGWAPTLTSFLVRGGVVVVLDTASPTNRGTWQILTAGGVLSASGLTDVSRTTMQVLDPGDAIAVGVPLTYRGERTSVSFMTTEGVVVIVDGTGAPVVIHRTSAP